MATSKPIGPQALEHLLSTLKTDYQHLQIAWNNSWQTPAEREEARQALVQSVRAARDATEGLLATRDAALRPLVSPLVIQVELGADAVKHPSTLTR